MYGLINYLVPSYGNGNLNEFRKIMAVYVTTESDTS